MRDRRQLVVVMLQASDAGARRATGVLVKTRRRDHMLIGICRDASLRLSMFVAQRCPPDTTYSTSHCGDKGKQGDIVNYVTQGSRSSAVHISTLPRSLSASFLRDKSSLANTRSTANLLCSSGDIEPSMRSATKRPMTGKNL